MNPAYLWRKSGTALIYGVVLLCFMLTAGMLYARFAGYELMAVQSNSMSPVMHTGDAVLINRQGSSPHLGDIVSFTSPVNPNLVITHRVIGVDYRRGMIETRGDNTSLVDQPVPAWNVIGSVSHVIPAGGYLLDLMKNPFGLFALIYLPAIGIVISEVRRLTSYYATGLQPVRHVHYRLRPGRVVLHQRKYLTVLSTRLGL